MTDEIRDRLRRRYEETEAIPPLEKLRAFLQSRLCDADSMEEVRQDLRPLPLTRKYPGLLTRSDPPAVSPTAR